jgi:hypothetical protein
LSRIGATCCRTRCPRKHILHRRATRAVSVALCTALPQERDAFRAIVQLGTKQSRLEVVLRQTHVPGMAVPATQPALSRRLDGQMRPNQHGHMLVTFTRTGERRYAVRATVKGMPELEMNPAPGYDALMPHDLQHFIVERALGIDGGVYGQLAAGGTVGTFHSVATPGDHRAAARQRRKQARKSSQLIAGHVEDCARSERATYVCWHDWLSHSKVPALRARAHAMSATAKSILQGMAAAERVLFTAEKLSEIRADFSMLSARWAMLKVGEGFSEPW